MTDDVAGATSLSGRQLQTLLAYAAARLRRDESSLNALNVFPVPDGDTGSNMAATLDAAVLAAESAPDHAGAVLSAAADGALLGARGNSGVILSQLLTGFARAVGNEARLDGPLLAEALAAAGLAATQAVSEPKPGTILTVLSDAAAAAAAAAGSGARLADVLSAAVNEAKRSVERTPSLLPVLREAGVVDSGGLGLATILEGSLLFLRGAPLPEAGALLPPAAVSDDQPAGQAPARKAPRLGAGYGYCTEFVVQGDALPRDALRTELERIGDSVIVVGTANLLRVHVHSADPGAALSAGVRRGSLSRVKVDNIDAQHEAMLRSGTRPAPPETARAAASAAVGVVAVSAGDGFDLLYRDYGAQVVIRGQGARPSTAEFLSAIERAGTDTVLVLPNDDDARPAAEQAANMSPRPARVLKTRSQAEGIAAMLAFNADRGVDTNEAAMLAAASAVNTIEITHASREISMSGPHGEIRAGAGQPIALLDGSLTLAGRSEAEALLGTLSQLPGPEAVSIFFGQHVSTADAAALAEQVRMRWPAAEVEVVRGGQPVYDYIVSVE